MLGHRHRNNFRAHLADLDRMGVRVSVVGDRLVFHHPHAGDPPAAVRLIAIVQAWRAIYGNEVDALIREHAERDAPR